MMRRGLTGLHWSHGKPEDASPGMSLAPTLAVSHRPLTSSTIAAAAERAALLKHIKYAGIRAAYDFVPVAIETLGPINNEGMAFLTDLGNRLSAVTRDPRESTFLYQRVSVCMQRANAIAFRDSFLVCDEPDD